MVGLEITANPTAHAVQNNLCDSLRFLQNFTQKSGRFESRLMIVGGGACFLKKKINQRVGENGKQH